MYYKHEVPNRTRISVTTYYALITTIIDHMKCLKWSKLKSTVFFELPDLISVCFDLYHEHIVPKRKIGYS